MDWKKYNAFDDAILLNCQLALNSQIQNCRLKIKQFTSPISLEQIVFMEETIQQERLNLNQRSYSQRARHHLKSKWCYCSCFTLCFVILYQVLCFLILFMTGQYQYIEQLALSPFIVCYSLFYLHTAQGRQSERFIDLFFCIKIYFKALAIYFLFYSFVIIGLLLLIVPGCIAILGLSQIYFIFAENHDLSILQIFQRSKNYEGRKMDIFLLMLSFTGWFLLCVLTLLDFSD